MRLFVALDLPDSIKAQLHDFQKETLKGAKWTKPEQWHITLHFIGESDEAPVREALSRVKAEAFSLRLRGIGTFPPRGRPNVLWVGIEAPKTLLALHQAIGDALKTTGFTPESRPYSPHLTLARFKEIKPEAKSLATYLEKFASFETGSFPIEHFSLYQSELLQSGAAYTIRERYFLE